MDIYKALIAIGVKADIGNSDQELKKLSTEAEKTEKSMDGLAKTSANAGKQIDAGLSGVGKALIGVGLVAFIDQTAGAFANAASAAAQLSKLTNASVEDSSRFLALTGQYGLGVDDLTEIFATLSQAAGPAGEALQDIGVTVSRTPDGMIDWVKTTEDFLAVLQDIPDGTEKTNLALKFLGEEGAKQLLPLINSGIAVEDALAGISTAQIFGTDDVQAAMDYNQAMKDLASGAKDLQFALGRALAPAIVGITDLLTPFINLVGDIPGEVSLAVGAFLALKAASQTALAASLIEGARASWGKLITAINTGTTRMEAFRATAGLAMGTVGALLKAAIPLAAVAAIGSFISETRKNAEELKDFVLTTENAMLGLENQAQTLIDMGKGPSIWSQLTAGGGQTDLELKMAEISRVTIDAAEDTLKQADATEAQKKAAQDLLDVVGDGTDAQQLANIQTEEGTRAVSIYTEALGASDAAALDAQKANKDLADIIATGIVSQEEYATAVGEAATQQHTQEVNARTQADAIQAVADATWDAVNATSAWELAQLDAEDAELGVGDAVDSTADAQDRLDEIRKKGRQKGESQEDFERRVRQAERTVARSTNNIIRSVDKQAQAVVEANGLTMDSLEGQQLYAETVQETVNNTDFGPAEEELDKYAEKVRQAKIDAEGGWTFGTGKWKGSTSAKDIKEAQKELVLAQRSGIEGAVDSAQAKLDKLKAGNVELPGIEDQKLVVEIDTTELDAAKATVDEMQEEPVDLNVTTSGLETIEGDIKQVAAGPYNATINVWTGRVREFNAALSQIAGERDLDINLDITNYYRTEAELDILTDDRDVEINIETSGYSAAMDDLDALDRDRWVTIHVGTSLSGGLTQSQLNKLDPDFFMANPVPIPTPYPQMSRLLGANAAAQRPNWSPTVNINNPAPERASDSIAMGMRVARYSVGAV